MKCTVVTAHAMDLRGQFKPEETPLEYLKSNRFRFCTGGYDNNKCSNEKEVYSFIKAIK